MQRLSSLKVDWRHKATFFIIALLVVCFDQLSKLWIELNLAVGESMPETGFFRLTHIRNTGASFGLFQDKSLILAIVSIIVVSILLYRILFMYCRFHFLSTISVKMSLGLVLGGMVGKYAGMAVGGQAGSVIGETGGKYLGGIVDPHNREMNKMTDRIGANTNMIATMDIADNLLI